jgi:transcriptional regulator with GAF, ATPase, and Fis domain
MSREALLNKTFVELADTLVEDFDIVELLTNLAGRCVEVFDVDAAGLMLVAPSGDLRVIASSSPAMHVLEMFEIQAQQGPCPDCYRTGLPVHVARLAGEPDRWPTFAPEAIAAGFGSVIALPLRRRGSTIGALNLFRHAEGDLPDDDIAAAQAFADIATIGLLNRKVADDAATVNKQLNEALTSRVVIEQAKGMVAERTETSVDLAFDRLRKHARRRNRLLADVAREIVDGTLSPLELDAV